MKDSKISMKYKTVFNNLFRRRRMIDLLVVSKTGYASVFDLTFKMADDVDILQSWRDEQMNS